MNDVTSGSETRPVDANDDARGIPIVGLGASAGGIKVLREFFAHTPPDSGIAYVVILHLSSEHESHLAEVLQSSTPMPISQVRELTLIEPDCVYVIPPNRSLAIIDGALVLSEFERTEERRAPIDFFFRTLGEAKGERAFAVILSGTGADGSSGLKRVKECGGCVYAQDPDEAEYADMPRNAVATGLVDQVLPVAVMGEKISAHLKRLAQLPPPSAEDAASEEKALRDILMQLRGQTGHEFSKYKRSTLLRRISRRINLHDLPDLRAYARMLRERPDEIQSLLRDLLISVTNFFRDKAAFEALERDIVPRLFEGKGTGDEVRAWVTACATGEEAYSIAMLLTEYADGLEDRPNLQVFATDIDSAALAVARGGCYTGVATADIAPQRLQRFFVKDAGGYRVRKELRGTVLFALHNLLTDPPFSRLDLVSCRNFLIYLNREAQKRALDILHYASRPGGYAFFGAAESAEGTSDVFISFDKEHRIYRNRALDARLPPQFPERSPIVARIGERERDALAASQTIERHSFADLHLRLLEQYAPPSLIVNEDYDIVHLSEGAGQYLQLAGGEPSHNLLKVAHYDLRLDLRTALYQATQQRSIVEARGLTVALDSGACTIDLIVRPVLRDDDMARGFILVIFADANAAAPRAGAAESLARPAEPAAGQLEEELLRVKARLRSTVEQHDIQAEEAMAANEELQAMNEELRSTGEELETGREELQSLNEELQTVNQELKVKIDELVRTNDDFQNLINATGTPTIFLDRNRRVKLFTGSARQIFNLIPADKGRVLSDISSQLVHPGVLDDIEVRADPLEREVETRGGSWFCMRVLPYRTIDNRLDGIVVAFDDITERKQAEAARIHFRALFEGAPGLYVVVNPDDYRIVAVSDAFLRATLSERQTIVGLELFEAFSDNPAEPWADGARNLRASLERVKSSRRADLMAVQRYPMRGPDGEFEERWWSPINSPVFAANGDIVYLILRIEDVTAFMQQREGADGETPQSLETRDQHMEAEIVLRAQDLQRSNEQLRASEDSYRLAAEQLKALNEKLEERVAERTAVAEQRTTQLRALATQLSRVENKERQRIAQVLHDHLQQLLLSAKFRLRTLKSQVPEADFGPVLESLDESLNASRSLVADLRPPILYHAKLSEALRWLAERNRQQQGLSVEVLVFGREPDLDEDMKLLLFQSVRELLLNITKHAAVDRAQIRVGAWRSRWLFVRVSDNGSGFRFADNRERSIANADAAMSAADTGAGSGSGNGLGLLAIRERIEVLGGNMVVRSTMGRGTRVVLRVPVERRIGTGAANSANPGDAPLLRRLSDEHERSRPIARTRILLVDDHTVVRQGLRGLIEEECDMQVVGEAQDGLQAIALAGELAPEVILMDINMPRMDGIEATRRIKAAHPDVRVIGLSMHADAGVMNSMRAAGVSDYVTKDTVADALCDAIREQVKDKNVGG